MNSGDTGSLMQRFRIASMSRLLASDMPAVDVTDRVELVGTARPPERDARALVEHPTHGKGQHRLAEALPRELL
jgi:hypothetical protein